MKLTPIFVAAALALAQPALAKKDRDDDEHFHGKGKGWAKGWNKGSEGPYSHFENKHDRYKYEYRDASCRYKYEYSYKSAKTKIEQKGDCSAIAFPQRAVVHGREPLPRAIPPEPQARTIECNREVIGAVLGGVAGAVVGSKTGERGDRDERFITTVGGAVIGAVVGGSIGKSMDDADHACAAQALEYANFKQSVRWHNKARGAWYTVTPVGLVPAHGKGVECRRYSMLTETGGEKQTSHGTACRQNDGSWRLSS
jgi:surface antigen